MCCSVLQCVAVCCSVLQCVAVCCIARYRRGGKHVGNLPMGIEETEREDPYACDLVPVVREFLLCRNKHSGRYVELYVG